MYGKNFPYLKSEITASLNNTNVEVLEVIDGRIMLHIPAGAASGKVKLNLAVPTPSTTIRTTAILSMLPTELDIIIDETAVPRPFVTGYSPTNGFPEDQMLINGFNFAAAAPAWWKYFWFYRGADSECCANITYSESTSKPSCSSDLYSIALNQGNYMLRVGDYSNCWTNRQSQKSSLLVRQWWKYKKSDFRRCWHTNYSHSHAAIGRCIFVFKNPRRPVSSIRFFHQWYLPILWQWNRHHGSTLFGQAKKSIPDLTVSNNNLIFIDGTGSGNHYIRDQNLSGPPALTDLYVLQNAPAPLNIKCSLSSAGKIYWSERASKRIMSGSQQGSNAQAEVLLFDHTDGLLGLQPSWLTEARKITFSTRRNERSIYVGNLDGSGALIKLPIPAIKSTC